MKKIIFLVISFLILLAVIVLQGVFLSRVSGEKARYKSNAETLMSDVKIYKTKDSLSAIEADALRLTIDEFKKHREEDVATIKSLNLRIRNLSALTRTQSATIVELSTKAKDTLIQAKLDTIPALALHCGDKWYNFDGLLVGREFSGVIKMRDSLLVAETIEYKRFLGFLWRTNKVKRRSVNVVSKNPYCDIIGTDYVVIEK